MSNSIFYSNMAHKAKEIIGMIVCTDTSRLVFKIKDYSRNTIEYALPSKLSMQKDFIQGLTPEEAYRLGYATAMEQCTYEKEDIATINRKKNLCE